MTQQMINGVLYDLDTGEQSAYDAKQAAYEADTDRKIAVIVTEVQKHLDTTAQTYGYDNIFTACTYADETAVPTFQAEGQALRAWRSNCWNTCYGFLAQWQNAEIAEMTPAEVVAALPTYVAP